VGNCFLRKPEGTELEGQAPRQHAQPAKRNTLVNGRTASETLVRNVYLSSLHVRARPALTLHQHQREGYIP
jgi:hypothetical protein